ncbi:MAG: DUF6753 family protein [Cyanobacteria bacterium J06576_12]
MSNQDWEALRQQALAARNRRRQADENGPKLAKNNGRKQVPRKRVRQERSYEQLLKDDPSGMAMLDQALEGATAEEKARVRGVLLRFGIETDHEFYIIFVAIGQLLILVEEAPENWRALFDDVHQELKLWSQENFKSLESIKRHAQTSADLIAVLRRLLDSMKTSESRSSETRTTLSNLSRKLSSIEGSLASMQSSSSSNQRKLSQIGSQLETLSIEANRRELISNFSLGVAGLTVVMLLVHGWTMGWRLNQQAKMIERQTMLLNRQGDRIDWLLEKANKEECLNGVKPSSDPQCRQFF